MNRITKTGLHPPLKVALTVGVALLRLSSIVHCESFDIFVEAQNALALVPSLSYRVHTYEQDAPTPSASMEWVEYRDRYRFRFYQFDKNQRETFRADVSYDGRALMTSTDGGKTVYVEEGARRLLPGYIKAQQMLLAPYDFVLDSAALRYWEAPCLQRLQSHDLWSTLKTRSVVEPEEDLNGKRYKILEVKGGTERFSGVPIAYKVYADLSTNYPYCIKVYDTSGRLLSELTVTQLSTLKLGDTGMTMLCPAEIAVRYFGSKAGSDKREVTNWQRFVFEDVVAASSADVALDLSSAEIIYDVKNETVIPIPR